MGAITAQDAGLGVEPYDRDDDLIALCAADGRPRLRVYCPEQAQVVLGRGSRPDQELELSACRQDGVPLLRRRGGGAAVVLDPGNLIVALVLPARGLGDNPAHFSRISAWLIEALAALDLPPVRQAGVSDLTLGERKIGGACIWRGKDLLFYSATLLLAPRVELLARYLLHPPREPAYRRGRSHAEFVGRLGPDGDPLELARDLQRQLDGGLGALAAAVGGAET